MQEHKMFIDLIKCVRYLEHIINFGQVEYREMYSAFTEILFQKTGLSITELYNLIEYITPDETLNELEAVGFFNKFIADAFNVLPESERKYYSKLIGPLFQFIWLYRDMSYKEIYAEGGKLIKKYADYDDPS